MAVFDSPITTYSDTTPLKRAITDVISLIDPVFTPAIAALGGLDGASGKFRFVNWPSTLVEWLEDTHAPLTDTMNAAATLTSTIVTITGQPETSRGAKMQFPFDKIPAQVFRRANEIQDICCDPGI